MSSVHLIKERLKSCEGRTNKIFPMYSNGKEYVATIFQSLPKAQKQKALPEKLRPVKMELMFLGRKEGRKEGNSMLALSSQTSS